MANPTLYNLVEDVMAVEMWDDARGEGTCNPMLEGLLMIGK